MNSSKQRQERRHQLAGIVSARVHLRSLAHGKRCVDGILSDASLTGLGIVVQENVALDSKCVVEIQGPQVEIDFQGEVCYARRTEAGIRLGVLVEGEERPIIDCLAEAGIELKS